MCLWIQWKWTMSKTEDLNMCVSMEEGKKNACALPLQNNCKAKDDLEDSVECVAQCQGANYRALENWLDAVVNEVAFSH